MQRRQLKRSVFTTDSYDSPKPWYSRETNTANTQADPVTIQIPDKFLFLLEPKRIKVACGGRGGAKSHSFARALLIKAMSEKHLILCTRQYQSSIADSVHRVLSNHIAALRLTPWFDIGKTSIKCRITGTEFIFKGIYHHPEEIKSLEGVTICWVEEAQAMTEESWLILEPTIRVSNSEIWVSFNPETDNSPTWLRTEQWRKESELAEVVKVGWQDNPWFPEELERQRVRMLRYDPEAYDWIWEGNLRKISDAAIFKNRYRVAAFETPEDVDRFYFGADWGMASDPTVCERCFIKDDRLFVDYEAYGIGVELEDIPALFAGGKAPISGIEYPGIPGAKDWPIKADSARPETISYVRRNGGMNISAAEKWHGSVEDGIAHLKSFREIVIHERCTNLATEARLYSYKVDPKQLDENRQPVILPIIVDKHNHSWDALRYSLDGYIQSRGGLAIWARLASSRGVKR